MYSMMSYRNAAAIAQERKEINLSIAHQMYDDAEYWETLARLHERNDPKVAENCRLEAEALKARASEIVQSVIRGG